MLQAQPERIRLANLKEAHLFLALNNLANSQLSLSLLANMQLQLKMKS